MTHPLLSAASLLLLAGLCFSQSREQGPPVSAPVQSPTIKVESRIVVVDVVVTDKQGQSVPGLRKDDFHVSEEGSPQTVTSFEEHKGATPDEVKLLPMPPNVFTNFPTVRGADSVNVLLLDLLNTQPPNQAFVRQQVIKYLGEVPSGTRLAVFALSSHLRIVRGFTTDFSGISATLEDKKLGIAPEVSRELQTEANQYSDAEILRQMRKSQAAPSTIDAVESFQRDEAAARANSRIEVTLQAFQQIARYLSAIPARKNLIWFSDNFPVSFFSDLAAEFTRIRITSRKPRTCSPRQRSPSILCLRWGFSETPPSMPANWPVLAGTSRLARWFWTVVGRYIEQLDGRRFTNKLRSLISQSRCDITKETDRARKPA